MLNKCPRGYSCGTSLPVWTDEPMPTIIGIPTIITAYGSASLNYITKCKIFTTQVEVMRCSLTTDHDLIYRYRGIHVDSCSTAFCGMS